MKAENFVSKLKKLTPDRDSLIQDGFPTEQVEQIISSYECIPLNETKMTFNDVILELIASYDCSNVEIGLVTFNNALKENEDYYIIGEVEADILALSKVTLEVEVLDHDKPSHVIWSCASNSANFLSALLVFASFIGKKIKDDSLIDNTVFTKQWVYLCTETAGGEKYIDFYKMLLGDDY